MPAQTNSRSGGFPADLLVDLRAVGGRGVREQLEQGLRTAVQAGRLKPDTPMPASRVLAAELGVSRSVVVEAYGNLVSDGYLQARQGSGTRVRPADPPRRMRAKAPSGSDGGFFERPYMAAAAGRAGGPLRLLGGLPDPALFPRTRWLRHYRAAMTELPDAGLAYPGSMGAAPLREQLAAYLGRVRGVSTVPEQLMVCTGFTQGVTLLCRALRRAGARRVAVEDPCFAMHRTAIEMTGVEAVPVPVDGGGLDVAALAAHRDIAAVLVAPAHSYPTGATLGTDRRRDLVAWAQERDALVIEDDYDAEFRYDRTPIGALQGLAPERVVYIGGASKTVTPALRLGWAALPPEWAARVEREKRFDDMGSPLLEQLAFARFVASGDFARHLRRVRPVYRARRDAALDAIGQYLPGVEWQGEAAGLHLHLLLPAGATAHSVAQTALERGLLIEDGAWHWADPAAAPPSLVLGYSGATEPAIHRGIAILGQVLESVRPGRST